MYLLLFLFIYLGTPQFVGNNAPSKNKVSVGQIAGIVIGILVFIVALVIVFFFITQRNSKRTKQIQHDLVPLEPKKENNTSTSRDIFITGVERRALLGKGGHGEVKIFELSIAFSQKKLTLMTIIV